MIVQPYLMFDGRCEEAINFYQKALGAKVEMLMRFKDNPESGSEGCVPPGADDKIMHSSFRIGETVMMATDGASAQFNGKPNFQGISLSLTVASEAEAQKIFGALSDGGQVQVPLTKTFFSPSFGVVADRFGVSWMVVMM